MGIILFIAALLLLVVLGPLGLLITFVYNFTRFNFRYSLKRFNYDLLIIAVSVDQVGNVMCKDLFNLCLITKKGYKFGKRKETISSVIGKNKQTKTLTFAGIGLDRILNSLEKNHSTNSIDSNV